MENLVYLVAVPKGKLLHCSQRIQKFLWDKYDLWMEELPEIHLTLDAVYYQDASDVENLLKVLEELLKEIQPFEVMARGFSYIPCPHNCITIHIVKTKELKNIYEYIHSNLSKRGFLVREFTSNEIVFHISLAGIHGRQWSHEESQKAWEDVKDFPLELNSLIDELELWYPGQYAEEKRIGKFVLLKEGKL